MCCGCWAHCRSCGYGRVLCNTRHSATPDTVQVPRKCKAPRVKGSNNKHRCKQCAVISEPVCLSRVRRGRRVLSLLVLCMLTLCGAVGAGMVVVHAPVVQYAVNAGSCSHAHSSIPDSPSTAAPAFVSGMRHGCTRSYGVGGAAAACSSCGAASPAIPRGRSRHVSM